MLLTMSEGKKVRDFHGQTIYLQEFQYGKDVFQTTTNNSSSFSLNWTKMVSIERLIEQCWIKTPTGRK